MGLKITPLKGNQKVLLIALTLFVIAAILFLTDSSGTLNKRNINFAVQSGEKIDRIEIYTNPEKEKLTLRREGEQWKVNDKFVVREFAITNFLQAISSIVISKPVSRAQEESVKNLLEQEGRVVEIYKNNRRIRRYRVSTPQMSSTKTYMMMTGQGDPFEVRIPSFSGLVADLYKTNEGYWRDKSIFDYQPQAIQTILVKYPGKKEASFQLFNYNDGTFAVRNPYHDKYLEDFKVEKVMRYFTYFHDIEFEAIEKQVSSRKMDSIIHSPPYCEISVTDFREHKNSISIYRKAPEKTVDEFGNKLEYDFNRAYAVFNQNNELIIIQYYIFDPLLKEIDYFR
ncbi:MAG: hypothetical protein V2I54_10740 [Bacteroidales bacterium]|jgi:hypothetical protein|nr:hypothetical protein [Bacteroidales bacterium]